MKKLFIYSAIAISVLIACKSSSTNNTKKLVLELEAKSGSTVSGVASFTEKNGFVTFEATIKNLKPGVHGLHIHEKADCSSADAASEIKS